LKQIVGEESLIGEDRVTALLESVPLRSAEDMTGLIAELEKTLSPVRASHLSAVTSESSSTEVQPLANEAAATPEMSEPAPWLLQVGEFVEPMPMLSRDELIREIIERIGRARTPVTPLLVGHPGSGRSAVLSGLAQWLQDSSYSGPLAGARVYRAKAHALLGRNPATTIANIAREIGPDAVLCVDDLEVAASLSRNGADLAFLTAIRVLIAEQRPRVILVIDEAYASHLAAASSELEDELEVLPVPLLSRADTLTVTDVAAAELEVEHALTIPEPVRDLALAPAMLQRELAQPGLALARLDRAAVRCRLDGRDKVNPADLDEAVTGSNGPLIVDALTQAVTSRVRGQDQAIKRICERLALTRAGLDLRPSRPDGVFLLTGPTGVGKTEFAKVLTDELLGGPDGLIRLDMSEYAQEWALSQITGPPPGYVGSTDPGSWLTTKVLTRPDAIVLLDEFEKSHPRIWNTFLQIFDDGRLTDSMGRTVDFSRTVFLLTSNLGAAEAAKGPVGFSRGDDPAVFEERMRAATKAALAPELLNRLDDVIVFRPLDMDAITDIARQNVTIITDRYRSRGFELTIPDEVINHLATAGYNPEYGARHLQRNIERLLLEPLVGLQGHTFTASLQDGVVAWIAQPSPLSM